MIRYFEKLSEDGLKPEELPVKSQVRLKVRFSEGNPSGPYKAYFHPQGKIYLFPNLSGKKDTLMKMVPWKWNKLSIFPEHSD